MPSIASFALSKIIRWFKYDQRLSKMIERGEFINPDVKPDRYLKNRITVETIKIKGKNTYIIKPEIQKQAVWIIYLHGGAYVQGFDTFHWKFIRDLIKKAGCIVVTPDYPLLPHATSLEMYDMVKEVYKETLKRSSGAKIMLMGDSAGGGLALGFAQTLVKTNTQSAPEIILLSPWLDITMENEQIIEIEPLDPILKREALRSIGKMLAKDKDPKNHLFSPLFGEIKGLGNIHIFAGTHDILVTDARALVKKAEEENIKIQYYEYPKMLHDWMLLGLPESKLVIETISHKIIKE